MKLSACITINDRSIDTLRRVFDSMRDQKHDEFVIVLDAAKREVMDYTCTYWSGDPRSKFVVVEREPGWRSPVKAWNRGYAKVTGEILYCFSSETVQAAGNIEKARRLVEQTNAVVFGKAECSCGPEGREVEWGGTAPGNLLCDAAHPRPLGFIWAAPMTAVYAIGGWDEEFDKGYWHDETDFFLRMWRTGLNFVFDDSISGTHLHHDRPHLTQEGINRNTNYMIAKHGMVNPLTSVLRLESRQPGRTTWLHP